MSAAQFVWCIVDRVVTPPRGAQLHNTPGDYHFYPVRHDGELTTVDISLWRETSPSSQGKVRQFPTASEVREAIDTRGAWWTLLATVSSPKARTADPATEVDLQPLPVLPPEFQFVGYDVVDTGALSGLANVGLRTEDLKQIDSLMLKANSNGLLADFEVARTLSTVMDRLAPEHSPFFPVFVYARRSA